MALLGSRLIPKTLLIKLKAPKMAAPMSTLIGPPETHWFAYYLKTDTLPESETDIFRGNPFLRLFFADASGDIQEMLHKAWNVDPLTTLKLICLRRGERGTWKRKEAFYASALWLHQFHPKTLAGNVSSIARFGYIKDLPEILYRLLEGPDVRRIQRHEWLTIKLNTESRNRTRSHTPKKEKETGRQREGRISNEALRGSRELRIRNMLESGKVLKVKAAQLREEKRIAMASKLLEKYHKDSAFRFLYERVSDFFAESLKADMEHLKSNETRKVSLAAKWCPSLDSSFDRSMLLCESIARKVFPRESYPEYEGLKEGHYVYRVRDRLRKEVLVPLRKVLELPEVYMSLNRWGEIPYNRVARVAMRSYRAKFLKHDEERFRKFLVDEESRKSQIAAAAKLPHEIIGSLRKVKGGDVCQITEVQWKTMVDDLRKQGKFKNCVAVSDLHCGTAMAVSLGLLVSELTDEPWKGKFITFNLDPTLEIVKGETLSEKVNYMKKMETDCFLDVQRVFDLILEEAVKGKLKEEDMIKRLIVFSPMDFHGVAVSSWEECRPTRWCFLKDDADSSWEDEYDEIVAKFRAKGYGNVVPEIVFWSLRDTASKPDVEGKKGVAVVTGFSRNFLKLFLNEHGHIDPVVIMEDAVSRREYQNLSVLD